MFAVGQSLFSKFEPLSPKETMGRNELCWCKSGRKWKHCHRLRQTKQQLPLAAMHAKFYENSKEIQLCLHAEAPTNCSPGAIRAHTVQKSSALKIIAENGHVLSGRNVPSRAIDRETLHLVGINSASTFNGFCAFHDSSAFRKADTATAVDKEIAFLLSYRALCYELYMKMIAVPTAEMIRDNLDNGFDFERQVFTQNRLNEFLYTARLGLFEHKRLKNVWDSLYTARDLSHFQWADFSMDRTMPVVTSGTFFPEYDFSGRQLQSLDAPIGQLALLAFNIIPIAHRTHAIFGWIDQKSQNDKFLRSLYDVDETLVPSSILQFCFETSDNIFVNPIWWSSIDLKSRSKLTDSLRDSTPGDRKSDGLIADHRSIFAGNLTGVTRHCSLPAG